MDNFTRSENIGRITWAYYLTEHGVKKNVFTEDRYCPYDGTLTGLTDITAVYELKYRDIPTSQYNEWMIEEKKAKPLLEAAAVSGYDEALYVVITQDDILIWDLKRLELDYTTTWCTKTTAEGYQKGAVPKSVAYLKLTQSICKKKRKDGMRLLLSSPPIKS